MDSDREAVETILKGASDEARFVLAAVLQIERNQMHMRRPPKTQIVRDIIEAVKGAVK